MKQTANGHEPSASHALVMSWIPIIRRRAAQALRRRRWIAGGRDPAQEVQDLCQHVLLCLFEKEADMRIHWDPERSASLPAFIRLLADREIASLLRSRRRSPWGEEPTDADTLDDLAGPTAEPEARLGARQSLAALSQRARSRLGSRGAELFELILLDELSTPQICARTGLSADAVYAWSSRIKRLLRDVSEEDSPLRTIAVRSIGARRVQRGGRGT